MKGRKKRKNECCVAYGKMREFSQDLHIGHEAKFGRNGSGELVCVNIAVRFEMKETRGSYKTGMVTNCIAGGLTIAGRGSTAQAPWGWSR